MITCEPHKQENIFEAILASGKMSCVIPKPIIWDERCRNKSKIEIPKGMDWLIAHHNDIVDILVSTPILSNCDCKIRAYLKNQFTFVAYYDKEESLWLFLRNKVFKDLPLNWFGKITVCGGEI